MLISENLKQELRDKFMHLKTLKIYSNYVSVNLKVDFMKSLPEGIRDTCSMILDFVECRVNTEEAKDNYMIVYASHNT